MSDKKPMAPEDKIKVEVGYLSAVSLIEVCCRDRELAAETIGRLSPEGSQALLVCAIEVGAELLKWSDRAVAAGGGISVREILATLAAGLGDELGTPPPTLQ
jgi:hypothetical protein